MKKLLCLLTFIFCLNLNAKILENVDVFPQNKIPGKGADKAETFEEKNGERSKWTNVSVPKIDFYLTDSAEKSGLVILCPGGGYGYLGYSTCKSYAEFLVQNGISAAVLRYRVPNNRQGALQDIQRSIRLSRSKFEELNIDPNKICVMGFSAGGHLAAMASTSYKTNSYEKIDNVDEISAKPDLSVLIYPAYLAVPISKESPKGEENFSDRFKLYEEIKPDENSPKAFIMVTENDRWISSAIAYYLALKNFKISAELHIYSGGGHGFKIGTRQNETFANWHETLLVWLKHNDMPAVSQKK